MKIIFFGSLAARFGREMDVDIPSAGCTIRELRKHLEQQHPAVADLVAGIKACVDQEIVVEDAHIRPGQELAFFPPLSGG